MNDADNKRLHVYVSGEVQGVFYRGSAHQEAERLGVAGWVKNLPDGRVEAVFEGSRAAVDEMLVWCERGPDLAGVVSVDVDEEEVQGESGFRVL